VIVDTAWSKVEQGRYWVNGLKVLSKSWSIAGPLYPGFNRTRDTLEVKLRAIFVSSSTRQALEFSGTECLGNCLRSFMCCPWRFQDDTLPAQHYVTAAANGRLAEIVRVEVVGAAAVQWRGRSYAARRP
jgi:hypothetical protein